jgi:hypothetical protein
MEHEIIQRTGDEPKSWIHLASFSAASRSSKKEFNGLRRITKHNVGQMRGLIIIVVVLVAASAMRHGSYRPLPTAPMPAVNVP